MLVLNILDAITDAGVSEIRAKLTEAESAKREAREAQTLAERERNNAVRDLRDYFEANLRVLADRVNFTATERISVYEDKKGGFGLIGRYCLRARDHRRKGRPPQSTPYRSRERLAYRQSYRLQCTVAATPRPCLDLTECHAT